MCENFCTFAPKLQNKRMNAYTILEEMLRRKETENKKHLRSVDALALPLGLEPRTP